VGGLVGIIYSGSSQVLRNSFWDKDASGITNSAAGTGMSTAQMQTESTFISAGWDFWGETENGSEDIWRMDGYPVMARIFRDLDVTDGTGDGLYKAGTEVQISATLPTGFGFSHWETSSAEYTENLADASASPTIFTMPDENVVLIANFIPLPTYLITTIEGPNGTISPTNPAVYWGYNQEFLITPDEGYHTATIIADGFYISPISQIGYAFYNVQGPRTLEASFAMNSYSVNFDLGDGSRSGGGARDQTVVHGGAAVAPTVTPPTGRLLSGWSVAFDDVQSDLNISAVYEAAAGYWELSVEGGSGNGFYTNSSSVLVTADTAPAGYIFLEWTAGPTGYVSNLADSLSASTLFVIPSTNVTLTANYEGLSGDFEYTVSGGEVTITNYTGGDDHVVIPVKIAGDDVTAIAAGAFQGSLVHSIQIPRAITFIGDNAFLNCTNLTQAYIPTDAVVSSSAWNGCGPLGKIYYFYNWAETGITIAGFEGTHPNVMIPSHISGVDVVAIGSQAFHESLIETVSLPDGLRSIDFYGFNSCTNLLSIVIPDSVTVIDSYAFTGCSELTNAIVGDGVHDIRYHAFQDCSKLFSVEIGSGVTNLGPEAFRDCISLKTVEIPDSVFNIDRDVFWGCSAMESATVGTNVEHIGRWVFQDCVSLQSIVIPDSVVAMDYAVFRRCVSLTNAIVGNGLVRIPDSTFTECENLKNVVLGGNVKGVGDAAFANCYGLKSINLPDGFVSIGESAFSRCESLSPVVLPNGLLAIGYKAFLNCDALTAINIPETVISLGEAVFFDCDGLTSVIIPDNITEINRALFQYCRNLRNITLPDTLTRIGEWAFNNCPIGSINLSSNIIEIQNFAFHGCGSLRAIDLPNITYLGDQLFSGCAALTSIDIPETVTDIGANVFWMCYGLTSVEIPENIASIGPSAFYSCKNLETIILPSYTTTVPDSTFRYCWSLINYLKYSVNTGEVTVDSFSGEELIIPPQISGMNVTSVAQDASYGNTELVALEIPYGVTTIGDDAFADCPNLASVIIPAHLSIEERTFGVGFTNIHSVVVYDLNSSPAPMAMAADGPLGDAPAGPSGEVVIVGFEGSASGMDIPSQISGMDVVGIGSGAFSNSSLQSVSLPNTLGSIGDSAFSDSDNLSFVNIPSSVTTVGSRAFANSENLRAATICSDTVIEGDAFDGCSSLTSTNVYADSDSDGLPDEWEAAIVDSDPGDAITGIGEVLPAEDFDGDGFSNRAEYIALTDPTNPDSKLLVFAPFTDGSGVHVSWDAAESRIYEVQATDDLSEPFETIATGIINQGACIDIPSGVTYRYYRIRVRM